MLTSTSLHDWSGSLSVQKVTGVRRGKCVHVGGHITEEAAGCLTLESEFPLPVERGEPPLAILFHDFGGAGVRRTGEGKGYAPNAWSISKRGYSRTRTVRR